MVTQTNRTIEELQDEITWLAQAKDLLNTQLIKAWHEVVSLEETNTRLFNENQDLIHRLRECESGCTLIAA